MANSMSQLLDLYSQNVSQRLQKQMHDEQQTLQREQMAQSAAQFQQQQEFAKQQAGIDWLRSKRAQALQERQLDEQQNRFTLENLAEGKLVPNKQTLPIPGLFGAPATAVAAELPVDITDSSGRGFVATTPVWRQGEMLRSKRAEEMAGLNTKKDFFGSLLEDDTPASRLLMESLVGRSMTPSNTIEAAFEVKAAATRLANEQSKLQEIARVNGLKSPEYQEQKQAVAKAAARAKEKQDAWELNAKLYESRSNTLNPNSLPFIKNVEQQHVENLASLIAQAIDDDIAKNPNVRSSGYSMYQTARRKAKDIQDKLSPQDRKFFDSNYISIMSSVSNLAGARLTNPTAAEELKRLLAQ